MRISELISALTQIKGRHGDVQVFGCDYNGEDCDPEPRLRKMFTLGDTQHTAREDDFERCKAFLAGTTLEKEIAAAAAEWERIEAQRPGIWTEHSMVDSAVKNFEYAQKIVDAWPTATPQVTL